MAYESDSVGTGRDQHGRSSPDRVHIGLAADRQRCRTQRVAHLCRRSDLSRLRPRFVGTSDDLRRCVRHLYGSVDENKTMPNTYFMNSEKCPHPA